MAHPPPFTPLAALDIVALDTETTGLDAATARLVQIGALRPAADDNGHDDENGAGSAGRFVTLVDPGVPIPPASTAIHGITDADVAGAPPPAEALARLAAFLGDGVVIGHTIAYDLEIMRREAERAGRGWTPPPALDIRPLAQATLDGLAGYDLDALCAGLDIAIEGRHSAEGDARAAAAVWAALLPRLRARGVRTLGEAQALSQRVWQRDGAGAFVLDADTRLAETAPGTIDPYPYRHSVADVMTAPPVVLGADRPLREALDLLIGRGISSVFVAADDGMGIVTERDLLRAIRTHGPDALDHRLADHRSAPLVTVAAEAPMYRAIGRMDRLGIRHLGVRGPDGAIVGAVTPRNLLRHRGSAAMTLGDETAAAADVPALAAAWGQVPETARRLTAEAVDARQTAGVVSVEIRMLTRRAAELAEAALRAAGESPPARYAVLVLGSAGRGESLLSADQDNAIIFDAGDDTFDEAAADAWCARLGATLADSLDTIGIRYCDGGVMAREPAWRRSGAGWRATVDDWIRRQRPEDLLNVDIFFDGIAVHGDQALGETLRGYALDRARATRSFHIALSQTLLDWRSPLATFGGFRSGADGRVDLKAGGLMPIFSAARILAIKAGSTARATPDRLRAAAAAGLASEAQLDGLVAAHGVILDAILRQQLADAAAGIPPGNRVETGGLTRARRTALRDALRQVSGAIDLVREGML